MTEHVSLALSHAVDLDLAAYRESHVGERVRRALERESVAGIDELVRLLRADRAARARFRRSVAVSVSGLFRDPKQFELLERELLPPLLADGRRIGVWSAGCSDGSELYSVAMLLDRAGALDRSFLLGSDLLDDNIACARRGVYGDTTVPDHLRTQLRWEQRDLLRGGAAPGKWRLVLCRNVAIYLVPDAKRALYEALARSLAAGGVLMIGRSERLGDPGALGLVRAGRNAYRRVP
jgi:chemotaxis protein methyltransferase CheR